MLAPARPARRRDRARRRLRQRAGDAACSASACPTGRVIGVDGSPSMIEQAREALAEFGDGSSCIVCDLLALELDEPVDAVFSNAIFHWILDHERCSSACSRRCGRAAGSRRSAAARATSPSGSGRSSPCRATSASPTTSAGCRRALELRLGRRHAATGSSGPASRSSPEASGSRTAHGRAPGRRERSSAPSASASTSSACRRSCTRSSSTPCSARWRARWCSTTCGSTSRRGGRPE